MAFVDKAKKQKIAAALKEVVPNGWKYSLAVRDHSGIVMSIYEAPFELMKLHKGGEFFNPETASNVTITHVGRDSYSKNEQVDEVLKKILSALDLENHDNSDSMTDYFDIGHYVYLNIGTHDRPFVCTGPIETQSENNEEEDAHDMQRPRG